MPVFLLRKKLVEQTEGNCSYAEYSASVGHCARGDFSFAFPLVPIYVTRMGSFSAVVPVPVSVYAREKGKGNGRGEEKGAAAYLTKALFYALLLLCCFCATVARGL